MTLEQINTNNKVYTLVDPQRHNIIYNNVKAIELIPGVMAEIGVYRGGSSFTIANACPNKLLYSCDSFEGLPESTTIDNYHKKGDFADVVFNDVKEHLKDLNVTIIKGFFPDEQLHKEMYNEKYAFVHLDVDLYKETLNCLEWFYPRMIVGGVIVIDDYKHHTCLGVEKAVDEFFKDKPEIVVDTKALSCIITKL